MSFKFYSLRLSWNSMILRKLINLLETIVLTNCVDCSNHPRDWYLLGTKSIRSTKFFLLKYTHTAKSPIYVVLRHSLSVFRSFHLNGTFRNRFEFNRVMLSVACIILYASTQPQHLYHVHVSCNFMLTSCVGDVTCRFSSL